jgi:intracellular septation protein
MPFIAGGVTISFGYLTIVTGDPMWVQIKVTLFNLLVACMLWFGLKREKNFFHFIFGKTFHYTPEGWYQLTRNLAIFFLVTAIANEIVRLSATHVHISAFHRVITGVDIWILFKLVIVMPLTGLYLFWQVRRMQKHRLPAKNL